MLQRAQCKDKYKSFKTVWKKVLGLRIIGNLTEDWSIDGGKWSWNRHNLPALDHVLQIICVIYMPGQSWSWNRHRLPALDHALSCLLFFALEKFSAKLVFITMSRKLPRACQPFAQLNTQLNILYRVCGFLGQCSDHGYVIHKITNK